MVKLNKWFINGSFAIASIVGSVIYVNKNKKPREINAIPPFFTGVAPYLFAHRGAAWLLDLNKQSLHLIMQYNMA